MLPQSTTATWAIGIVSEMKMKVTPASRDADRTLVITNFDAYDKVRIVEQAHLIVDTRNALHGLGDGQVKPLYLTRPL